MSAIPGDLETNNQPPMIIPLRHFIIGLGFLLLGSIVGTLLPLDIVPGNATIVHVHLLLIGWVCITIMGAMTQFVPVWSGTTLHSRRLSTVQLWLVLIGITGFTATLLMDMDGWIPVFGALILGGFWVFVYNIARTLAVVRPWDITERHFVIALIFFVLLTILGITLALSYTYQLPSLGSVTSESIRMAHATIAVFGAVLTTVIGALYQLGTMFTQSDLYGIDKPLKQVEAVAYPGGVFILAVGRLVGHTVIGQIGGTLLVSGLFAFGLILARRLYATEVGWTPMLRRYAVVAGAMMLWSILALPHWYRNPVALGNLFGSGGLVHLFLFGIIGFVIIGTLYHIVPFIIWVHQYSDKLGLEDVPMIDDLYSDRLAYIDFVFLLSGNTLIMIAEWVVLPEFVIISGGILALGGFLIFSGNILLVIHNHSPHTLAAIILPAVLRELDGDSIDHHKDSND